jgi:hypothetical protein
MRVTVTAVSNGRVSANANGPVELVSWNGESFNIDRTASALMIFNATTKTVTNPITGEQTIDADNPKNIKVRIY